MEEPGLIDGLSETQPDTASMTSRLAAVIAERPGRAQDELEQGMYALECAYRNEPNKRLKKHIEAALKMLRHGPEHGSDEDSASLYTDD